MKSLGLAESGSFRISVCIHFQGGFWQPFLKSVHSRRCTADSSISSTQTLHKYSATFQHWVDLLDPAEDPTNSSPILYNRFLEDTVARGESLGFVETATAAISHYHLAQFRELPTAHPAARRALTAARCLLENLIKRTKPITPELIQDLHQLAYKENDLVT